MTEELFADRIGNVAITGGVVRIDLMTLEPAKPDSKGGPTAVLRQRVIMTADGFVGLANAAVQAMARLEQMGLVKRNEPPQADEKTR